MRSSLAEGMYRTIERTTSSLSYIRRQLATKLETSSMPNMFPPRTSDGADAELAGPHSVSMSASNPNPGVSSIHCWTALKSEPFVRLQYWKQGMPDTTPYETTGFWQQEPRILERFAPMVVAQNELVVGGVKKEILRHDCGLPPETFILRVTVCRVQWEWRNWTGDGNIL